MVSDAQKRATAKYQREKSKSITLRFFAADMDVYGYIKSQPNQTGYIKDLVRKDMQSKA